MVAEEPYDADVSIPNSPEEDQNELVRDPSSPEEDQNELIRDPSILRPFIFLELPREIRNRIYELLFRFDLPLGLNHDFKHDRFDNVTPHVHRVDTGLLATCSAIYREAHSVFRNNHFTFELSHWHIRRQSRRSRFRVAPAPQSFYKHVRNLTLYMSAFHKPDGRPRYDDPPVEVRIKHNDKLERAIEKIVHVLHTSPLIRLHLNIRDANCVGDEDGSEGDDYTGTLEYFRELKGISNPKVTFHQWGSCHCGRHRLDPIDVAFAEELEEDMHRGLAVD